MVDQIAQPGQPIEEGIFTVNVEVDEIYHQPLLSMDYGRCSTFRGSKAALTRGRIDYGLL